jgi:hypothetical protein
MKRNFSFKYKADVLSFVAALVICPGLWFYNTPNPEIALAFSGGLIETGKFVMLQLMIAVATWSMSKTSYDFLLGDKKRSDRHTVKVQELVSTHASEQDALSARIKELELGLESGGDNGSKNNDENGAKLLEILEGRT